MREDEGREGASERARDGRGRVEGEGKGADGVVVTSPCPLATASSVHRGVEGRRHSETYIAPCAWLEGP